MRAVHPGPRPTARPATGPGAPDVGPEIVRALEGQGYRDFRKDERKHGLYEVKALSAQGHVGELYVDGATGQILAQRQRRLGLDDD